MIRIMRYGEIPDEEIFFRGEIKTDVAGIVSEILDNVKKNGDAALREYAAKFDGGAPENLEVSEVEYEQAMRAVDPELLDIMRQAAENIRDFHKHQVRSSFVISEKNGIVLGQKVIPIEKVGLYVPGGTAAYPSTVLMDAIPARLAGCGELVITTPAKNGVVNPVILAAARVAGVDRVFKTGGAQAIAALAYGTQTVPKVDKIVGPGNAYVAEAKKQVYGQVSIDMIAGPSEILIVADGGSNPRHVAADMLSRRRSKSSSRYCPGRRSRARPLKASARSSCAKASPRRSTWQIPSRRSIWSSAWISPSTGSTGSKTRAACSWAVPAPKRWAIIFPVPTIRCPRWARRVSPARFRWMTS